MSDKFKGLPSLKSKTARQELPIRKKPYWAVLSPGIALGYRRNAGAGTWSVRVTEGSDAWVKRLALADDVEQADGRAVMNLEQATNAARALARREPGDVGDNTRPITVFEALDKYETELKVNGGSTANATRVRCHVGPVLGNKAVATLTVDDLKGWRNSLTKLMAAATVNRTRNGLRAALELAAKGDRRIVNQWAFKEGLKGIADAQRARNVILTEPVVLAYVAEAHKIGRKLGVLMQTLAVTGARPSQITRCEVADFEDHRERPRLMVPRSGKGGTKNRAARKLERISVPITLGLAALLRQEAAGRPADAPLLTQDNGAAWGDDPSTAYRADARTIATTLKLDPDEITPYALRHSSIVRALLANVNIRVVADNHDTSVKQIETNYSRHINQFSDEMARRGLLADAPAADNVITLPRAA